MFKSIHNMKGQSTLEYAVLIMIIIAALLTIQTYVKRGIQGKMKSSADDIGDQFSPGNTNATRTTKVFSNTQELFGVNPNDPTKSMQGASSSKLLSQETTNTTDNSSIMKTKQEYWGRGEQP